MARGQRSEVGDTTVSANGYNYTRTESGWRLTHHLIAEAALGRPIDTAIETIRFKDGDKTNLDPENILVTPKKTESASKRLAKLISQRAEIDAEIKELEASLAKR